MSDLNDAVPFVGYAEPHTHQGFTEAYESAWVASHGEVLVSDDLDFDVDPSQVGLPGQAERLASRIAAAVNVCRSVPTERLEKMVEQGETLALIAEMTDILETFRDFTHSALDGGIHQENLDHYEGLANALIGRGHAATR